MTSTENYAEMNFTGVCTALFMVTTQYNLASSCHVSEDPAVYFFRTVYAVVYNISELRHQITLFSVSVGYFAMLSTAGLYGVKPANDMNWKGSERNRPTAPIFT
jgi:hypothetical protein